MKVKKSDYPVCPVCKARMVPKIATGWDTLLYWECNCSEEKDWKGLDWEYGITIH